MAPGHDIHDTEKLIDTDFSRGLLCSILPALYLLLSSVIDVVAQMDLIFLTEHFTLPHQQVSCNLMDMSSLW